MIFKHNDLKQYGIFSINNFISEEECELIIKETKTLTVDSSKVRVDSLPSEYRVWNAEKVFPSIQRFLNSEPVEFCSSNLSLEPSFCIYNHIKPGEYGSGGGWHRDTRFQNQYKCIVYLTDCNEGNGNFAYLRKSHLNNSAYVLTRFMDFFKKPRYDYLKKIFNRFSKNIYGSKGTAIIVNTTGIHRGTPVTKGERHALTIYFNNGVDLKPKK
jgi:hypothetical protein